ncbi:MAG: sigma-70 family RNA polymerase sigma factor [Candidatus Rokubacteria bacterium]|nr:sigma-70 family RNA polymerase sigma factor [Candidatus Rokubacteria bacterium]
MSGITRSDEALMQEVRAGSQAAFQALYDRHHRGVFNFLLRSLGDSQIAEDLLQETFLRVFTHREEYRPTAAFRTWLFTIARNLLVDQLRQRSGSRELADGEPVELVEDPGATPLQQAEAQELGEWLQAAVLKLSPSQREVLLLSRFAGLSHEEIARITGISPVAVRVTLHRALRRLRDLLGPL